MIRKLWAICAMLLVLPNTLAQTVTVSLTSPQDGLIVPAGATVEWSISFSVSADNAGFALIGTDLLQGPHNPTTLDFPR